VDGSTSYEVVNDLDISEVEPTLVVSTDSTTKRLGDIATSTIRTPLKGFILDPASLSAYYVLRSLSGRQTAPKDMMVKGESVRMEAEATATEDRTGVELTFNVKEDANANGSGDMEQPFFVDVYVEVEQVAVQRRAGEGAIVRRQGS